ncbi:MAG TPA: DUF748 domain-containing protein [Candidatus Binatia bacterium]|nr:DUF748 domain-containing protein [Candidatus Binatia bacterium]
MGRAEQQPDGNGLEPRNAESLHDPRDDAGDCGKAASSTDAGSPRPRRRRRRWPWVVMVLAICTVAGLRVALPTLVERGAAYGSRYWLGLPVRIDNADFALLQGSVVLEGISIGARPDAVTPQDAALEPPPIDAAAALLHLGRISARISWRELLDGTVRVLELAVDKPSVRVERETDGSIDPLRHAAPLAPPSAETEEPASGAPWKVLVERFALAGPDVRIVDPASGENLLELGLEDFSLDDVAVDDGRFGLGNLGIRGPKLRVRRDLVVGGPASADPPKTTAPTPAPDAAGGGYSLDQIHIERAILTWITDAGPVDVALALDAREITADQGRTFPLDLQLEIQSGRIALKGDVGILPPSYAGTVAWNGLPFPPLLLASVPQLAPWLRAANSTAELRIDGDFAGAKGTPAMQVAGHVRIDAVAVSDPLGQELAIGWKELEVDIEKADVPIPEEGKPSRATIVALRKLRLLEPKISYTRPSPALDKLLGLDTATATAEAAKPDDATDEPVVVAVGEKEQPAAGGPLQLAVASLELAGGDIEGYDRTLEPAGHTRLRNLSLTAQDVRFPDAAASNVRLAGTLPETARLTVAGDLRSGNQGDFTVELEKLDLPPLGSFTRGYGANLESGQFSTRTRIKLRGSKIEVTNDLLLHKLGISLQDPKTFEKSFGVPVDLALALLRDPAGNIRLSIPVKVDEKGAEVPVAAILARALRQALIGAVTAPLKMVGAVFSGIGKDESASTFSFDPLPSRAGTAEPAGDEGKRLDGMVKLLKDRPSLGLELRGRAGPEDRDVLAEQILIELQRDDEDLPEVEGAGFLARRRIGQAIDKRAKGKVAELSDEDQALYQRYIAAVEVPKERFDALATARAERVRALLLEKGVAEKRVSIGHIEPAGAPGIVLGFQS